LKQFGLSAKERIKSKNEFDLVYSKGEILFSSSNKLKAVFFFEREIGEAVVKTAFAVSSKSGKAVWRNRVKRILRNSLRLNKQILFEEAKLKKVKLLVVLSPNRINELNNKNIYLKDVQMDVIDLLDQIRAKL
jgi:ribonuclease P protein component